MTARTRIDNFALALAEADTARRNANANKPQWTLSNDCKRIVLEYSEQHGWCLGAGNYGTSVVNEQLLKELRDVLNELFPEGDDD